MKHLEESHKQMEDEMDMDVELERELEREADDEEDRALCRALEECTTPPRPINKVPSLPANFTFSEAVRAPSSPARRRRTLHSHVALLPAAAMRRASLSPHALIRRRTDSGPSPAPVPPPTLLEEEARFIDADDGDDPEPASPPATRSRRDSFHNRRPRADKRNSLRGEEARLLRPALLAVPRMRRSPPAPPLPSPPLALPALLPPAPLSEEENIRSVIAERRRVDAARPEAAAGTGAVELSERGS